jgi:hypothetical protein
MQDAPQRHVKKNHMHLLGIENDSSVYSPQPSHCTNWVTRFPTLKRSIFTTFCPLRLPLASGTTTTALSEQLLSYLVGIPLADMTTSFWRHNWASPVQREKCWACTQQEQKLTASEYFPRIFPQRKRGCIVSKFVLAASALTFNRTFMTDVSNN